MEVILGDSIVYRENDVILLFQFWFYFIKNVLTNDAVVI